MGTADTVERGLSWAGQRCVHPAGSQVVAWLLQPPEQAWARMLLLAPVLELPWACPGLAFHVQELATLPLLSSACNKQCGGSMACGGNVSSTRGCSVRPKWLQGARECCVCEPQAGIHTASAGPDGALSQSLSTLTR